MSPAESARPFDMESYAIHNQADYEEIQSMIRRVDGPTPPSQEELNRFLLKLLLKGNQNFLSHHQVIHEFIAAVDRLNNATGNIQKLVESYGPLIEKVIQRLDNQEKTIAEARTKERMEADFAAQQEGLKKAHADNIKDLLRVFGAIVVTLIGALVWFFSNYGTPKGDNVPPTAPAIKTSVH